MVAGVTVLVFASVLVVIWFCGFSDLLLGFDCVVCDCWGCLLVCYL